jgi:hypothetical protein
MAINFPDTPSVNDIFTAGSLEYLWTGSAWIDNLSSSISYSSVTNKPTEFAPSAHDHLVSDITDLTATATELNILDGVTATSAELNILDGVTADATELNILDGVTATTAELNILDGVTADATELNILDGVTADATELNILDGVTATTAELNILDGVTADATELNILDGVTADATELNYVEGVTSAIQSQIDGKVGRTNGSVTTASTSQNIVRNITLSTDNPSGGADGDVWLKYTA